MKRHHVTRFALLAVFAAAAGGTPLAHSAAERATLFERVLVPYEAVHAALAGDELEGVSANAQKILAMVREAKSSFTPGQAGIPKEQSAQCQALLPKIEAAAERLSKATTLAEAREAFGELSRPMVQWREMVSGPERPKVVYCPMAKKPWLQESDQVANPYFGSKMLRCGKIVSK